MKIGIIGGSGLYSLDGAKVKENRKVKTPFGMPSDPYTICELGGKEVCFLPRHGKGHRLLPSEINHRANIFGFKKLGVERVVSVSAVGSLKENLRPRDIVLPDQYFDRTKQSLAHTFFGRGIVGHVSFAEPACAELRKELAETARKVTAKVPGTEARVNTSGTYVNMEGPAFSTRAESLFYKSCGFDIIGMTSLAEAKLCREAGMCYQAMAMVTDYDCWRESEEAVTIEMIIGNLTANTGLAKAILADWLLRVPSVRKCTCADAAKNAVITGRDVIPAKIRKEMEVIIGRRLS